MPVHNPLDSDKSAPQVFLTPLKPALIVGSAAAFLGFNFGAFRGIVSGRRPIVSGLTVGGTWFGFASIYWYSRLAMIRAFNDKPPTSREKLIYSTAAGSLTGGINAALNRGPRYIWPSAVFFSGLGLLGQATYSQVEAWQQRAAESDRPSLVQQVKDWSPFRSLSEEEYEALLVEKLEQTKADIASLDQKIMETRRAMNAFDEGTSKG